MTEQTPTPLDPLNVARAHLAAGQAYLEDFEDAPRDPRQIALAGAHFAAASAIADIELAGRKPSARGR